MATRSLIALENADGTCSSIYCHWDGYPEYVGAVLKESYTTLESVKELQELGDLSSLRETLEDCIAYHRDRGEELQKPHVWKDRNELAEKAWDYADAEYVYLFVDGEWLVSKWREPNKWESF